MRNSFNTAGFSEVVHEIRNDPAEAQYVYHVAARHRPRRGLSAEIRPALLGSVKSARTFTFDLSAPDDNAGAEPTPVELALTGVASCTLTALVGGGSAKGSVFETVEMSIEHGASGPVRARIDVGGELDEPVVLELVDQVRRFSPNFTTMTAPVAIELQVRGQGPLPATAVRRPERSSGARVRWISGTQFESQPLAPGREPVRVDSPKQLTGVDWGPNPQEHLLMGLAADLAAQVALLCEQDTGRSLTWEVLAQAEEDVRGLLQADSSVVVHLQDVRVTVLVPAELDGDPRVAGLVARAFEASAVAAFVQVPQTVELSVHLTGC